MDWLILEIFQRLVGIKYLPIKKLERISIGFDPDVAQLLTSCEEMIDTADSGEDFDVIFGKRRNSPTGKLGEDPQSFDAAGAIGVFNVELVVAGELFGQGIATAIRQRRRYANEWPD